jgi:hypothetical protein
MPSQVGPDVEHQLVVLPLRNAALLEHSPKLAGRAAEVFALSFAGGHFGNRAASNAAARVNARSGSALGTRLAGQ